MMKPGDSLKSRSEATTASEVRVPGEPGIWVLILGEMSVFASLFFSFLLARSGEIAQFHASSAQLDRGSATLNTLLLLTSSLFVAMGVRAAQELRPRDARRSFLVSLIFGLAFVAVKGHEYYELVQAGITIGTDTFFSYYFGLTILHLIHVVAGVMLLALLAVFCGRREFLTGRFALVESAGCWWHMVDLLWVIIFPLLYLME